ncbi:uncharacterized protein VNE69_06218 [Vairimorpha necatrix]|uniref:Uncharacterized protein n=1 Tax=Vairimorpha necatrix TaxID=6039 RepID=A0AAX4JD25_9MICR
MIFNLLFLFCTEVDVNNKDNKNREYTSEFVTIEEDKMFDYVDYNENLSYKTNECNEYENSVPMELRNDILLNQNSLHTIFLQDTTQSNCDYIVLSVDLETSDLEEIYQFEMDIDQSQESIMTTNIHCETSEQFLLAELKKKIEEFIKQKKFELDKKNAPLEKIYLNEKAQKLVKNYNDTILEFKKNFTYRLKKLKLNKLREIIAYSKIPADVKTVLHKIIEVFKLLIKSYDNRKNFITFKNITNQKMILMLRNNIEIMSILNYIPILKTFKEIKEKTLLRNYDTIEIENKIKDFYENLFIYLQELYNKSVEIIETYEKCIILYEKKTRYNN